MPCRSARPGVVLTHLSVAIADGARAQFEATLERLGCNIGDLHHRNAAASL